MAEHRNRRATAACLLAAAWVAGCAVRDMPASSPLADTGWRLVAFQSMDDAVGTRSPRDPFSVTLQLHRDGRATLQLNCRDASARWAAADGPEAGSGGFELTGPALPVDCPAPDLEQTLARQAPYLRSWLLRDGRLYLNLMADGGTFVWEPYREQRAESAAEPGLEAAIRAAQPDFRREITGGMPARYAYSRVDLDADGQAEVLAYLLGPFFCGTGGCNLLVFRQQDGRYRLLQDFPLSRTPVIVADSRTQGWRDLWRLESGGGVAASWVLHRFDGSRYVERQRLPGGSVPAGTAVLAGPLDFASALPLLPGE